MCHEREREFDIFGKVLGGLQNALTGSGTNPDHMDVGLTTHAGSIPGLSFTAEDMKSLFGAEHYGWVNACGAEDCWDGGEHDGGEQDGGRCNEHGWVGAFDSEEESLDVTD